VSSAAVVTAQTAVNLFESTNEADKNG